MVTNMVARISMLTRMGMVIAALVAPTAGCAGMSGAYPQRGSVVADAPNTYRALVAGPAVVRVFSMDRGGLVYTATAVTATDADCARGRAAAEDDILAADSVRQLAVGVGEVACLTADRNNYELLWKARPQHAPATAAFARATP